MVASDEFFLMIGVVFPNRVRALFEDDRMTGLSGPYDLAALERMGERIAMERPAHEEFQHYNDPDIVVASDRRIVRVPMHSDMVVRFVHFGHEPGTACRVMALAAGPADMIDQLAATHSEMLPLTRRELQLTLDLAAGRSLQDVSKREGISISTVRNQIKSAMRSTSTHSQAHLASIVRDWLL